MLQKLFKSSPRPNSIPPMDIEDVDPERIPFLSHEQIIAMTEQTNRLRNIRRLTTLDNKVFNQLYEPALARYVQAAQLQPASTVDHHAYLGGLVVHTLEVIENSLKLRQQYLLPKNAPTERILEEEHVWTYAVFAGALLHDAGKLLTLTRLRLSNGSYKCPFSPKIDYKQHYSIDFTGTTYSFQTKSSGLMFGFLPEMGAQMLSGNVPALAELTGWLFHEPYEWGTIGEIVRDADGRSVSRNIKSGGAKRRLPTAQGAPLAERFIRAIRSLIHEKEIGFNRNGAAGWIEGEHTYLVCGPIIDAARAKLQSEGSSDIPEDNPDVFTILQDHGYVVPNSIGRAIWHVNISGDGYKHPFTMLKFETSRIFHPSMRPSPFKGSLTTNDYDVETDISTLPSDDDAVSTPKINIPAPKSNKATAPAPESNNNKEAEPYSESETVTDTKTDTDTGSERKACKSKTKSSLPNLDDSEIGTSFFDWVKLKLSQREITINKRSASIHTTPVGTVLVSPGIFKDFLKAHELQGKSEDALEKRWRLLQKHVIDKKLHYVNASGNNVHYIKITIGDNSGFFSMLFPHEVLWASENVPKPNELLEVAEPDSLAPATETAAIKKQLRQKQKLKKEEAEVTEEDDFELERE